MVRVFTDNDVPAQKASAGGCKALLGAIKQGKVDGLVVCHNDRLYRQERELEDFIYLVDATGIAVVMVITGVFDLGTASGRMADRILGAARAQAPGGAPAATPAELVGAGEMDLAEHREARAASERKVGAVRETLARSVEEGALQQARTEAVDDLQARWDGLYVEERRWSSGRW